MINILDKGFFARLANRRMGWGDILVTVTLMVLIYAGVRLAVDAPAVVKGPYISLEPRALPWYAMLSIGRMAGAYALSMTFSLAYGYAIVRSRRGEQVLLPFLDILQSVPILSFLPVVLLSLSSFLPDTVAAELASIVLIFTSQAWNLTFAWYQSLTTIPKELTEASRIFRFNGWLNFKTVALPFAGISLIWNSVMSWAGGWFFLMAAEIFTVGKRDFRLAGLGAYLQEAANQGNKSAVLLGIAILVSVIVILDQIIWRPLLVWGQRFKLDSVGSDAPPTSWFYDLVSDSVIFQWVSDRFRHRSETLDMALIRELPPQEIETEPQRRYPVLLYLFLGGLAYGIVRTLMMLSGVTAEQWASIGIGIMATALRVFAALALTALWTIPVGVAIGTRPRLATLAQPVVQIMASIPATALFPVFLLLLIRLPGGLNIAAVLLMLMGTQWYMLFNVIAGVSSIPQDLRYTATMLGMTRWQRWKTLYLPSLVPFLVTGAITAGGGAWNASIVSEHVAFGGKIFFTTGIGSSIAHATEIGDYPLLLASTLTLVLAVIMINRLIWRRLYRVAEERFRME